MRPFLSDSIADRIMDTLRQRAFLTRRQLADPVYSIAFRRPDGSATAQQAVLIVWANTQPTGSGADSTVDVLGQDGEVQAWGSLDAPVGSTFAIGADTAEITVGVIVDAGLARAGFRVTRSRA